MTLRALAPLIRCGSCQRTRSRYSGEISTKSGELEPADELKLRIEEASQFRATDQLAISCQCGFGSMMEGNPLTVDQQWANLDRMLEVADEVWS
jgi:5-methyltetrahydropteroyltriglutamate--homocysteine methyltransferase